MIVTIDGPAGTGKSTAARCLADDLGFQYLDTGAMYRMVALATQRQGIDPHEESAVAELAASLSIVLENGQTRLNGADVGGELRTADVTFTASIVAQHPRVRAVLVDLQRAAARGRDVVCEGRDQGTVVFPEAECKFFLTADPEERARRRMCELEAAGTQVSFSELLRDQTERDARDAARSVAPLKPAVDAILVDTTALSLDEVVAKLKSIVHHRQHD